MGEEVLVLSERIKTKESPGKSSTENRPYFDKDMILSIESRENLNGKYFYWLKNTNTGEKLKNSFQRQ